MLGVLALTAWVIYLDAVVRDRFEGRMWSLPAQIYARPLLLNNALLLSESNLLLELNMLGYKSVQQMTKPGEYVKSGSHFQIYLRAFAFPDKKRAAERISFDLEDQRIKRLGHRDALGYVSALPQVRLDPLKIGGFYPAQAEDRELLKLDEIPQRIQDGLIAVEDKDFYHHHGVAFLSIARAAWANFRAGKVVQGGSTLTQQLVKNLFLTRKRSYVRKLNEVLMSWLLEFHYSKSLILETYLNEIYLGQSGAVGIHGIGMASQFYFGLPVQKLNLDQQALLIGLIKGPGWYNPRRHPDRAMERRNVVLQVMAKEHIIDPKVLGWATKMPLGVIRKPTSPRRLFPGFIDLVKQQLQENYSEKDIKSQGLRVFSTLNPVIQYRAEHGLANFLNAVDKHDQLQGSVVITSANNGEVKALIGNRHPHSSGFNRALNAIRPIGSLVKPAIYLAALENPQPYTLISPLNDRPFSLVFKDGERWDPQNYSKTSHGTVSLHEALAHSYNLSTSRLGLKVGLPRVRQELQKLGVTKPINPYPSLLLGAISLSPFDVAKMYLTLSSHGYNSPLRAIQSVESTQGHLSQKYPYHPIQVLKPSSAYLIQYLLEEVMHEGTGRGLYDGFPKNIAVAGKTGTTNQLRDSWFAGFTNDLLGVVWIGKDNNGETPFTGSSGALRVWRNIMRQIPQKGVHMEKPDTVKYMWVNDKTQVETDKSCPGARWVPFVKGTEPLNYKSCGIGVGPVVHWFKKLF